VKLSLLFSPVKVQVVDFRHSTQTLMKHPEVTAGRSLRLSPSSSVALPAVHKTNVAFAYQS
jgi:hypothetical protein